MMRQYGYYDYQYESNQGQGIQNQDAIYAGQQEISATNQNPPATIQHPSATEYSSYPSQPYGESKSSHTSGHIRDDQQSTSYSNLYYSAGQANHLSSASGTATARSSSVTTGYAPTRQDQNYLAGANELASNQYQAPTTQGTTGVTYQYNSEAYRTASPANVPQAVRSHQTTYAGNRSAATLRKIQYSPSSNAQQETQPDYAVSYGNSGSTDRYSSNTTSTQQSSQAEYSTGYGSSTLRDGYHAQSNADMSQPHQSHQTQQSGYLGNAVQADHSSAKAAKAANTLQSLHFTSNHGGAARQQSQPSANFANVLPVPQAHQGNQPKNSIQETPRSINPAITTSHADQRSLSKPPSQEQGSRNIQHAVQAHQPYQRDHAATHANVIQAAQAQRRGSGSSSQKAYQSPITQTVNPANVVRVPPFPHKSGKQAAISQQLAPAAEPVRAQISQPSLEEHTPNDQVAGQVADAEASSPSKSGTSNQKKKQTAPKTSEDKKKTKPRQRRSAKKNENEGEASNTGTEGQISKKGGKTKTPQKTVKDVSGDETSEIKALMSKMRELHARNPLLLAQMWQEENRKDLEDAQQKTLETQASQPNVAQPPAPLSANISRTITHSARRNASDTEKKSLAQAAAKYLNSQPANTQNQISVPEILLMINKSPTYIELCEWLEGKKISLERYEFARTLRSAVPAEDENSQTKPLISQGNTAQPRSRPPNEALPTAKLAADYIANSDKTVLQQQPSLQQLLTENFHDTNKANGSTPPQPPKQEARRIPSVASMVRPMPASRDSVKSPFMVRPTASVTSLTTSRANMAMKTCPAPPKPPLIDKAGAARKRNLMDLVDLTALSDDDDDDVSVEPPLKKQALAPPGYQPASDSPILPRNRSSHNVDYAVPTYLESAGQPPNSIPLQSQSSTLPPKALKPSTVSSTQPARPTASTFVPLRAMPPQPHPHPFPHQQHPLTQQQPQQISAYTSIQFTKFIHHMPQRLPPTQQSQNQSAVSDRVREMDVVRPLDKRRALRRSGYDVKTIARDILIATGKHPDMRPLNGHLECLKRQFIMVDTSSDLGSFRWDLVDPGGKQPEITGWDDEDEDEYELIRPPPLRQSIAIGRETAPQPPIVLSPVSVKSSQVAGLKKRRGRHPRSAQTDVPVSASPIVQAPVDGDGSRQPILKTSKNSMSHYATPRTVPPNAQSQTPSIPGGGSSYKEYRAAMEAAGHALPRRGRPPGWRKSMMQGSSAPSQAPSHAAVPNHSTFTAVNTRPKPMLNRAAVPNRQPDRNPSPELDFQVFKCEWKNCSTELHNLETLRKHVFKVHRNEALQMSWSCTWNGCGEQQKQFKSEDNWQAHMFASHFTPLAWEKGDGPKAGVSDTGNESEAYLSDSHGRRVTPVMDTSQISPDNIVPVVRGPGRPRRSVEQEAREAFVARQRRARMVGPGVDRSGSKIVNEKRRLGFLDDEDGEEIIEDPEYE